MEKVTEYPDCICSTILMKKSAPRFSSALAEMKWYSLTNRALNDSDLLSCNLARTICMIGA